MRRGEALLREFPGTFLLSSLSQVPQVWEVVEKSINEEGAAEIG